MKNYFIIILLAGFLFSCGKKVTVKGRVYNLIDNEGIEGVDVQLSRSKVGFFAYDGAGSKAIENTTTDQDGNYLISYRHNNRSFRLFFSVDEEQYINTEPVQYNISQQNNTIDVPLVSLSFLKLKISNVNCEDSDDEIFYQRHWLSGNESSNGVSQFGCFDYEGEFFKVPMGAYKYTWDVTRNGVTESFEEEFYIDKGEEKVFEILY